MLKTMKADMSKAVEFSNTFRYIDDLKDTTLSSTEVCYLDTKIVHGDSSAPFHIGVYDKREDFDFRIVNFPFMDSNIPATPAYGVYISQLVRYARICTAKVDFMHRLRRLSSRLKQQGFKSTLLVKSVEKFFKRHCTTMVRYNVIKKYRSSSMYPLLTSNFKCFYLLSF